MKDLTIHQMIERATQGCAESQFELGCNYYSGSELSQDYIAASDWFEKASDQGHVQASYNLGWMNAVGEGCSADLSKAMKFYGLAAERGHANAQNNLANLYERRGEFVEAARWYRLAADSGLPNAQASLGFLLSKGRGVPIDEIEAVKYYRLSADQGFAPAQSNLGAMYAKGRGVDMDPGMAVHWIQMAAEQGYGPSQETLGHFSLQGFGVPADGTIAAKWFLKGATQGLPDSQNELGILYATGNGVEKDLVHAYMWFSAAGSSGSTDALENSGKLPLDSSTEICRLITAAAGGAPESQRDLAIALHEGKGIKQDADAAHYWLHRAAQSGDSWAQTAYALGLTPINNPEIVRWLSLAADQNDPRALFNLGLHKITGEGTASDIESGVKLLLLASLGGFNEARGAIDTVKSSLEDGLWESLLEKIKWPKITFILGPLAEGHLDSIRVSQENDDGSEDPEWLIFEREFAKATFLGATGEHSILDTLFGEKVTVKQIHVGRAYINGKTNTAVTISLRQIQLTSGEPVYWKPSEDALNSITSLIALIGARAWARWSYAFFESK